MVDLRLVGTRLKIIELGVSVGVLNICATHRFTKEQCTVLCVLLFKLQWTKMMSSCLGEELLILAQRLVS